MARTTTLLIALLATLTVYSSVEAQTMSTLTYQGQLKDEGSPASGSYFFRFRLWDAEEGGSQIGATYTASGVEVENGLFSVGINTNTFGLNAFDGGERWLSILVYDGGAGWVELTPRQPITPAPYAMYALNGGGGSSQWAENGSDIYFDGGLVGIGHAIPAAPLHAKSYNTVGAVVGENHSGINGGIGVSGQSSASSGSGVHGTATVASGTCYGVYGSAVSSGGYGVYGTSTSGKGVAGYNGTQNYGYLGYSNGGVYGRSQTGYGLRGYSVESWGIMGTVPNGSTQAGIVGAILSDGGGILWVPESGVVGSCQSGKGVSGRTISGIGVYGTQGDSGNVGHLATGSEGAYGQHGVTGNQGRLGCQDGGVIGTSSRTGTPGVYGESTNSSGSGVHGVNGSNQAYLGHSLAGLYATSTNDKGIRAQSTNDWAIFGLVPNGSTQSGVVGAITTDNGGILWVPESGVVGSCESGKGVAGRTNSGIGVYGEQTDSGNIGQLGTTTAGVYGHASNGTSYGGYFVGNVHASGTLSKGGGSFKIDHPLDPEHKYLYHSFVESPDMMNIYNGNVVLDDDGKAVVSMPDWFEALNMEFRYQLTCIGGFAQVYVAEEINNNEFAIAGGKPGLKVSWQVTGVRQDPFANANRIPVEVVKPDAEQGTYLHPQAWGKPKELRLENVLEQRDEQLKTETAENSK